MELFGHLPTPRGLYNFFGPHVLQHGRIEDQISYGLLQPGGLFTELLRLANLVDLQSDVLLLPSIIEGRGIHVEDAADRIADLTLCMMTLKLSGATLKERTVDILNP